LVGVILFTAGIAASICFYLGKRIPKYLERINYTKLSFLIIIFMACMVFLLTGPFGLLIVFTSTSIGILCAYLEVRRSHCMGVLLLPTIFFFAGLTPNILRFIGI